MHKFDLEVSVSPLHLHRGKMCKGREEENMNTGLIDQFVAPKPVGISKNDQNTI